MRDSTQSLGRRVVSFHECLERFNLFGFQATRERLRQMVGANGDGWSEAQLLEAMNHMAVARQSWISYFHEATRRRAEYDAHKFVHLDWAWRNEWQLAYLTGDVATRWRVGHLGDCVECAHPLVLHGSWMCRACGASPSVAFTARCKAPLPD